MWTPPVCKRESAELTQWALYINHFSEDFSDVGGGTPKNEYLKNNFQFNYEKSVTSFLLKFFNHE